MHILRGHRRHAVVPGLPRHVVLPLLHAQRPVELARGPAGDDVHIVGINLRADAEVAQVALQLGDVGGGLPVAVRELPDREVALDALRHARLELREVLLRQHERNGLGRVRRCFSEHRRARQGGGTNACGHRNQLVRIGFRGGGSASRREHETYG